MLEIFRELRGLLHVSHVHIDSWVFRLHYSVTTTCMFAFSLIVSAKQYVGNPIDCIHTKDIPEVIISRDRQEGNIDNNFIVSLCYSKIAYPNRLEVSPRNCCLLNFKDLLSCP